MRGVEVAIKGLAAQESRHYLNQKQIGSHAVLLRVGRQSNNSVNGPAPFYAKAEGGNGLVAGFAPRYFDVSAGTEAPERGEVPSIITVQGLRGCGMDSF